MPRPSAIRPTALHAAAALLALACAPLSLHAQTPEAPPAPPPPSPLEAPHRLTLTLPLLAQGPAPQLELLGSEGATALAWHELVTEGVVKGAPYCATAVHERIQTLADGNRISKKQSTQLCRDGEGRTRRELQRDGGARLVYLNDPVAKESWVLDPEAKTARRLAIHTQVFTANGTAALAPQAIREQAERWREWAKEIAEQARRGVMGEPGQPGEPGRLRVERHVVRPGGEPGVLIESDTVTPAAPGASAVETRRDVRVLRLSDLPRMQAPMPPMPPLPPAAPMPLGDLAGLANLLPRGPAVTTALPPKEIEGVKVNGERTTWTLEAGKIGNERPIVTTREVWRSPELMLVVSSREADPRSGEIVYRLEKLKRGEPDASLMKPPADYTRPAPPAPRPKAPAASDTRRG